MIAYTPPIIFMLVYNPTTILGKQIAQALEGNLSLDDPNEEVLLDTTEHLAPPGNIDYSNRQYKEVLKKFRKMALESSEQGSSECSGSSSESAALHQSVSRSEYCSIFKSNN